MADTTTRSGLSDDLRKALHAAVGETSRDALRVVKKAIKRHGVPQRLLTDNGLALNPSRRGFIGQLVEYVYQLGVDPITGKPYKPTTQGKPRERASTAPCEKRPPVSATTPSKRSRSR